MDDKDDNFIKIISNIYKLNANALRYLRDAEGVKQKIFIGELELYNKVLEMCCLMYEADDVGDDCAKMRALLQTLAR